MPERPSPPGGPLRQDEPDADVTPGEPAPDPGPEVQRVTRDEGGEDQEENDLEGQVPHLSPRWCLG